jgi:hypothetical protein
MREMTKNKLLRFTGAGMMLSGVLGLINATFSMPGIWIPFAVVSIFVGGINFMVAVHRLR